MTLHNLWLDEQGLGSRWKIVSNVKLKHKEHVGLNN